jgi:hypothetical protein
MGGNQVKSLKVRRYKAAELDVGRQSESIDVLDFMLTGKLKMRLFRYRTAARKTGSPKRA